MLLNTNLAWLNPAPGWCHFGKKAGTSATLCGVHYYARGSMEMLCWCTELEKGQSFSPGQSIVLAMVGVFAPMGRVHGHVYDVWIETRVLNPKITCTQSGRAQGLPKAALAVSGSLPDHIWKLPAPVGIAPLRQKPACGVFFDDSHKVSLRACPGDNYKRPQVARFWAPLYIGDSKCRHG